MTAKKLSTSRTKKKGKSPTVSSKAKTKKATKPKATPKATARPSKKKIFGEYAKAPESQAVVTIKEAYGHFINGSFTEFKKEKSFPTYNPATNEKLALLSEGTKAEVDQAVKAAKSAFKDWSQLPGHERGRYLYRLARLMQERSRELAVLETLDNGKPIKETRDVDIPLACNHFFYYAGWADKLKYLLRAKDVKPIGVCGQIIPWNFPLLMAAWKLAPALAAGNTVVLKPAETTSLTALLLAEIIEEAGFPKGVINIVTGAGTTGQLIVEHPDVKKLAFTGSTDIGKHIAKSVAASNKKLTLELGGKSAHIIYEDAAIDQAIEGIVNGIYFNQGHVCCAGSRLLVEESIASSVIKKLKRRIKTLRVGDPMDKNTDIGAINSPEQLKKIKDLVKQGVKEGANLHMSEVELPKKGNFHAPCFFTDVTNAHTIGKEEIFGPVLSIMTFRTPEEAITKANDTPYGLAAGIWSEKGSKIHWTAQRLRAGVIWSNTYNKFDPTSPFGGVKESGIGREGGMHGLFPYVEIKS